jgi:hypothetical protein
VFGWDEELRMPVQGQRTRAIAGLQYERLRSSIDFYPKKFGELGFAGAESISFAGF